MQRGPSNLLGFKKRRMPVSMSQKGLLPLHCLSLSSSLHHLDVIGNKTEQSTAMTALALAAALAAAVAVDIAFASAASPEAALGAVAMTRNMTHLAQVIDLPLNFLVLELSGEFGHGSGVRSPEASSLVFSPGWSPP